MVEMLRNRGSLTSRSCIKVRNRDFVARPERALNNLASLVAPGGCLILLVAYRSAGGLLYRLEKSFIGVRVNLFETSWLVERAGAQGLCLVQRARPLPWNAVFVFVRSGAGSQRSDGSPSSYGG
jgi:hypothetical protein